MKYELDGEGELEEVKEKNETGESSEVPATGTEEEEAE